MRITAGQSPQKTRCSRFRPATCFSLSLSLPLLHNANWACHSRGSPESNRVTPCKQGMDTYGGAYSDSKDYISCYWCRNKTVLVEKSSLLFRCILKWALLERMGELVSCKQWVRHCQCKLRLSLFQLLHLSLTCVCSDSACLACLACTTIYPCASYMQLSKAAVTKPLRVVGLSQHRANMTCMALVTTRCAHAEGHGKERRQANRCCYAGRHISAAHGPAHPWHIADSAWRIRP